jgi:hypothetical protein
MLSEYLNLLEQIQTELRCPIDWGAIAPENPDLVGELIGHWIAVTKKYQRDNECRHFAVLYHDEAFGLCGYDPDADPAYVSRQTSLAPENLDEVKADLINIRGAGSEVGWIQSARDDYKRQLGPLSRLRIATDQDYRKHFASDSLSKNQILIASKGGVSYFYHEAEPDLENIIWSCLDDEMWRQIVFSERRFVFVRCDQEIGATKGRDTRFVKCDFDMSTPQVHAYPIPEEDIPGDERVIHAVW